MSESLASPPPPTAITYTIRAGLAPRPPGCVLAAAAAGPRQAGVEQPGRRREALAARHRKIANCRRDFHHKTARTLVEAYDLIALEDLAIANMVRRATPVADPDNPGQFLPNGGPPSPG